MNWRKVILLPTFPSLPVVNIEKRIYAIRWLRPTIPGVLNTIDPWSQLIKIRHGAMVHFCIKHQGCQTIQQYRNMIEYTIYVYEIYYTFIYCICICNVYTYEFSIKAPHNSLPFSITCSQFYFLCRWKGTVRINLEGDTQKNLLDSAYIAFHSLIESNRTSWSAVKVVAFPFDIPLRWQKIPRRWQ